MRNYLSLTRVLLKNSASAFTDGKAKNQKLTYALFLLLGICLLPTLYVLYILFEELFVFGELLQQEGVIFLASFQITSILIFLFSLLLIPAIYYFSRDVNTLLSLPLSAQTIIASKFTVCLLYEYAFTAALCLPLFGAYISHFGFEASMLFHVFLTILTLPIYPLVLSSLFTMLLMRFTPFMKNRDRANMTGSILLIVCALAFSVWASSLQTGEETELLRMLLSGNNSLLSTISYLFPALSPLAKWIVQTDFLSLLLYAGIIGVCLVVFLIVANLFYFKGVIGVEESGASRKKLSKKGFAKHTQKQNVFMTYAKKEFRTLLRTPAFATNCLVGAAIMPIMVIIMLFSGEMRESLAMLPDALLAQLQEHPDFIWYIILAGLICGFLCANLNLISATSISREGSNYTFMKYIPIPLQTQMNAKVFVGTLVSIASTMGTLLPLLLILRVPIIYCLLALGCSAISIVLGNYLGIIIDLLRPKLVWEQEAVAVKQNLAGFISLTSGIGLAFLFGFLAFKWEGQTLAIFAIVSLLGSILLCFISIRYANKLVEKVFYKL